MKHLKIILSWIVLFNLQLSYFSVIACTDTEHCEHRRYGHRRALLHTPTISIPQQDGRHVTNDYGRYLDDMARFGEDLRAHLFRAGAFEAAPHTDVESALVWQKAYDAFHNLSAEISEDDIQELYLKNPDLSKKKNLKESLNKKIEPVVQKIKNMQAEIESETRNVASFGFVFFDQDGNQINPHPFHFSPDATPETLEDPFFFFSGQPHRDYRPEKDTCAWTALPAQAPKTSDLDLRPPQNAAVSAQIDRTFQHNLPPSHLQCIHKLKEVFDSAHKGYQEAIDEALVCKAIQHPFFNYVYERATKRAIKKEVCPRFLELLKLPALPLRNSLSKEPSTIWYPTEKNEEVDQFGASASQPTASINEEKDFTHSEQYALFQGSLTFEKFSNCCIQRLLTLLQAAESAVTGESHAVASSSRRRVASYACLIYSRNIMCARCAQATIVDFAHTGTPPGIPDRAFKACLDRKLDELFQIQEALSRPMVFLAGYRQSYCSELHGIEPDDFELRVQRKTLHCPAKDITVWNGATPGYETCSPEETPEMIYHYHVPS